MNPLRQAAALFLVVSAVAFADGPLPAGPFPLPSVDGKPLAVTQGQKTFRLPMRFSKVEQFYRDQLGGSKEISLKVSGEPGGRVLSLSSKRKGERWTKATVREGEVDTNVEVTQVVDVGPLEVNGNGKPLVQF